MPHSLVYKMEFTGLTGKYQQRRNYVCPECGLVWGLERRSKGKMPYCLGDGKVEYLRKVKYNWTPDFNSTRPNAPTLPKVVGLLKFWALKSQQGDEVGQIVVDLREQRDGHGKLNLADKDGNVNAN